MPNSHKGPPYSPPAFVTFPLYLLQLRPGRPSGGLSGGVSTFIDDYFRWRVGWNAEESLANIQSEVVPRIDSWAGGMPCFVAEKSELIHITRERKEQSPGQLVMNGKAIKSSSTARI